MEKKYKIILIAFFSFIIISSILLFLPKKIYLSLIGNKKIILNINEQYKELGYKAEYCNKYIKLFCKNLNNKVEVSKTQKENNTYFIEYKINYNSEEKKVVRKIEIKDTESPNIELTKTNKSFCPNEEYIEEGFSAYDNVDGNITEKVKTETKDNKVYYSVSDSSGNKKIVYRTINYNDLDAPIISLNGGETNYIYLNSEYKELGYSAMDNCDGDITNNVIIESNLDTSKIGEYNINYTVNDNSGNKTVLTRKVIVYNDTSTIPKNGKIVYITFDDGPGPYTDDILNILDKYNVKVTFFVTHQFSNYEYLLKKEYEKGHSVAVHTYSHNYGNVYSSVESYIEDFNNMNDIIYTQTGTYSKLFRFPGGSSNTISRFNKGIMTDLTKKMTELGYIYFDWNIDSMDTSTKDPETIAQNVINEIQKREHSVVLMHDIKKANIESIEKIIKYGLENGYTFLPLDETSPITHHHINN